MKVVFATEYYHPWAPGGTAWSLELLARALIARAGQCAQIGFGCLCRLGL